MSARKLCFRIGMLVGILKPNNLEPEPPENARSTGVSVVNNSGFLRYLHGIRPILFGIIGPRRDHALDLVQPLVKLVHLHRGFGVLLDPQPGDLPAVPSDFSFFPSGK